MNKVKTILIMLLVAPVAALAAEAAVETVSDGGGLFSGLGWKEACIFILGMLGMQLAKWVAAWADGKGQAFIQERLAKFEERLNANELLGQLACDDALFKIVEDSIPELFTELSETVKQDLKDGKFDSAEWKKFASDLWERVKPHVEGGKNDYLKNSSFKDGQALVQWVVQKWIAKKAEKES